MGGTARARVEAALREIEAELAMERSALDAEAFAMQEGAVGVRSR